ncbi:MAG TPA: hypothetical protein ENG91_02240 [Desulfobacteraceae bacterium]|nr:hypothetical protein [Desulfobacteraceae bacterium]
MSETETGFSRPHTVQATQTGNHANGLSVRLNRRGTGNEDLNEGSSRQTTISLFARPGFFSGVFGKDTGTASIAD